MRELGSDLHLHPDPWKILWIRMRIRQNDADPLDLDPQHRSGPVIHIHEYGFNFSEIL